MSINFTLWPNPEGPLGKNKVTIPDGINVTWPEGDALVGNFVYNEGKLVGFVDTMALVANESNSTTIPYDFVDITVDKSLESSMTFIPGERCKDLNISYAESGNTIVLGTKYLGCKTVDDVKAVDANYKTNDIVDGVWTQSLADLEMSGKPDKYGYIEYSSSMFNYCSNLTTFTSDLSSLTDGSYMFNNCFNLTTFTSDLSSLTTGGYMFYGCSKLTTFTNDLSSLTDGSGMFGYCSNLTTFTNDLSSLTDGSYMFQGCSNLTTFNADLSSLTNGHRMFEGCDNLTTFTSDLRSLFACEYMFGGCTSLSSFNSDLSSLTNALWMFLDTKLDTQSVQNIAESIRDIRDLDYTEGCYMSFGCISVGIANSSPNTEEDVAFRLMANKGWTVYVNGDGSDGEGDYDYGYNTLANLATLDEIGEVSSTPIPFYAKPIQTDEKHARYIDDEGNYFNILGGQFIYGDDLSTYGMFLNEEDAAANMRLTKIEK